MSSPTAHHQPPPPASANTLPLEIWMQILESIDHSDTFARPSYVNCFTQAILSDRATEAELVPELPTFEKEAWRLTRPYYAINATSRQAAHQTFLSGVLLQTCTSPLHQVPLKRNRGIREPHLPRTSIPPPFYASSTLARMRPRRTKTGQAEPTYMPLELFDYSLFHETSHRDAELKTFAATAARNHFMMKLFNEHYDRLAPLDTTLLRSVRSVDLLAAAPYEGLMDRAGYYAELLRRMIEMLWKALGVEDGVVRVLH
jgi:hypothetical protein